ncbi:hypothetical protein J27TS8_24880 [Robertmurraya siralis]|uniref:Uncharacterized protein n=1 Tax=Robertmurraya siralis TaxID=77777 RepID=A0A920BTT0_9BACI|nr:hypothetical protein J27TS8_24880 [Robertmurraya siralis]
MILFVNMEVTIKVDNEVALQKTLLKLVRVKPTIFRIQWSKKIIEF